MKDNNSQPSIVSELLIKYAQGKCTPEELKQVRIFLDHPDSRQALEQLLKDDFESFQHSPYTGAANAAWIRQFRENYTGRSTKRRIVRLRNWIGYAAACVLVIITGYWYLNDGSKTQTAGRKQIVMLEKMNRQGKPSVVALPDGTIVYLGAASSIRYPDEFDSGSRKIELKGEAYFEVAHDKEHPFAIQTGNIQTTVLGTTFKVNAFDDVVVSVTTGKVQVAKLSSTGIVGEPLAILAQGQQVTWSAQTGKILMANFDTSDIMQWKTGKVSFANASLATITETLERWHSSNIRFSSPRLGQTKMSMILDATVPLETSIAIICSTLHLKYSVSGKTILIKPR